jgi:hypothetical protein
MGHKNKTCGETKHDIFRLITLNITSKLNLSTIYKQIYVTMMSFRRFLLQQGVHKQVRYQETGSGRFGISINRVKVKILYIFLQINL